MTFDPVSPPQGTLRDWLGQRAKAGGTGFVFAGGGTLDWADLQRTARAVAADLTARGVTPGESVAVMMPNGAPAVQALFGILYGGFRATMINLVAGSEAISFALGHSDARFAFVDAAQADLFATTNPEGRIAQLDVNQPRGQARLRDVAPRDPALLVYTSGTTGRPKGVVHTQSSLLAGGWTTAIAHALGPQDRGFCVLPIYHINGLCVSVMGALVSGGSLAMCATFSAGQFWDQLEESKATWFSVVPTILSHLLHSDGEPSPETHARLRFGRSASSALSPDVHSDFEARFGVPIVETMGLTETAAQILSNPCPPGLRKVGSAGLALGNQVRVTAPDLSECPRGQEGEIVMRGPNVMREYLKDTEATGECLSADGWLRTGDLGRQDSDGYFFITGRLKDLIIKGGENIAPREIDEALYAHADVIEAAAFARPCANYGETVAAAVVLKPGSTAPEAELRAFCQARLGKFKSPDRIYVMDALPKGPSGKILRRRLAEILAA